MNAIWIVLPILTLLMFELGLTLQTADFKLFCKRPRPIIAGLAGQIILLPILAFAISHAFCIEPLFFIGIMLIACSPGGSSSNIFSMIAKGDVALSVSLTAFSSLITLFTLPIIMEFTIHFIGNTPDMSVHLPVGSLIVQNLVLMLFPIVAGILMKHYRPTTAEKIHKVLRAKEMRTLVIEIGMQNAAQAIAIASSPFVFNNDIIAIPAIIYALLMNVILLVYVGIIKNYSN